jgi:hypothetical protein
MHAPISVTPGTVAPSISGQPQPNEEVTDAVWEQWKQIVKAKNPTWTDEQAEEEMIKNSQV